MDPNLLQLVVASGLTLLGILVTAIIWNLAKIRTVMWWLGLSLVPIGVYLLGLGPQVAGAYETLRAWVAAVELTPMVWVGIVVAGLGVLLMLVSRVVPAKPRARKADAAASGPGSATRSGSPAVKPTPTPPVAPKPQRTSASQPTPPDADLDEITAILKRRGIE